MGYTNYYEQPYHLTPIQFENVRKGIKALIQRSPCSLQVYEDAEYISFNGTEPEDCEKFSWDLNEACGQTVFTKTNREPYDAVVFASLLAIKNYCPSVRITTDDCSYEPDPDKETEPDGDPEAMGLDAASPQHQAGIALYRQTFPRTCVKHLVPWRWRYNRKE